MELASKVFHIPNTRTVTTAQCTVWTRVIEVKSSLKEAINAIGGANSARRKCGK